VWHKPNRKGSVIIVETDSLWALCHAVFMSRRWRGADEDITHDARGSRETGERADDGARATSPATSATEAPR
jgi:hypothetical protein